VLVVARFEAQAAMAHSSAPWLSGHSPATKVIEEAAAWSGGVLRASDGMPMTFPGFIDVVYDTVGSRRRSRWHPRARGARHVG